MFTAPSEALSAYGMQLTHEVLRASKYIGEVCFLGNHAAPDPVLHSRVEAGFVDT
jgi:hypothetical protein